MQSCWESSSCERARGSSPKRGRGRAAGTSPGSSSLGSLQSHPSQRRTEVCHFSGTYLYFTKAEKVATCQTAAFAELRPPIGWSAVPRVLIGCGDSDKRCPWQPATPFLTYKTNTKVIDRRSRPQNTNKPAVVFTPRESGMWRNLDSRNQIKVL